MIQLSSHSLTNLEEEESLLGMTKDASSIGDAFLSLAAATMAGG